MHLLLPDEQPQERRLPRSSDGSRRKHGVQAANPAVALAAADPYVIIDFNHKSSGHSGSLSSLFGVTRVLA
jgi:hypothetical protein